MRYKLEFQGRTDVKPMFFDDTDELDAMVELFQSCPTDDVPVKLKITEYRAKRICYK